MLPSVQCWSDCPAYPSLKACPCCICSIRLHLKCDGTHTETRFHLSAKWTSPFKLSGASVQLTTSSRGVCISGSDAGYTKFRGSVKGTGYSLHLPVSPSLPLPCVTVCHHISTTLHFEMWWTCCEAVCINVLQWMGCSTASCRLWLSARLAGKLYMVGVCGAEPLGTQWGPAKMWGCGAFAPPVSGRACCNDISCLC